MLQAGGGGVFHGRRPDRRQGRAAHPRGRHRRRRPRRHGVQVKEDQAARRWLHFRRQAVSFYVTGREGIDTWICCSFVCVCAASAARANPASEVRTQAGARHFSSQSRHNIISMPQDADQGAGLPGGGAARMWRLFPQRRRAPRLRAHRNRRRPRVSLLDPNRRPAAGHRAGQLFYTIWPQVKSYQS